jgi:hypothetical protein
MRQCFAKRRQHCDRCFRSQSPRRQLEPLRCSCACKSPRPPTQLRSLAINQQNTEFCNNRMSNTKYSALSFVPRQIYEQFSAPMNLYFLLIAFLQLIPSITPVSRRSALSYFPLY